MVPSISVGKVYFLSTNSARTIRHLPLERWNLTLTFTIQKNLFKIDHRPKSTKTKILLEEHKSKSLWPSAKQRYPRLDPKNLQMIKTNWYIGVQQN